MSIHHHATCTYTDIVKYEFCHIQKKYLINEYDNYPQKVLSAIITRKLCNKLQYETLKQLKVHAVRCSIKLKLNYRSTIVGHLYSHLHQSPRQLLRGQQQ